jgi:DNA-binding NarL/FixJ family response regulator
VATSTPIPVPSYLPPVLLPPVFSARERQIIYAIAAGLSNFQIGRRLSISPRTVEAHIARIYSRLPDEWRSRVGLARMACRAGWLD